MDLVAALKDIEGMTIFPREVAHVICDAHIEITRLRARVEYLEHENRVLGGPRETCPSCTGHNMPSAMTCNWCGKPLIEEGLSYAKENRRLRARIEELESVCQSLQEDVGHAMATANHREDQRAAAVDRYKQAEQRVEELEHDLEGADNRNIALHDIAMESRQRAESAERRVAELVRVVRAIVDAPHPSTACFCVRDMESGDAAERCSHHKATDAAVAALDAAEGEA